MKKVMKHGMLTVLLVFVVNIVWSQFDDLYYEPSSQKVRFSDYDSNDDYSYIQSDEAYGTRVHNNTNDYDYDDEYSYATRINRFHRGGGFDYFSPMHCMSSFAFMGGSPWAMGMGPGFGSSFFMFNNYIDPFWYNGWSWNRWNRMNRWNSWGWGWNDPFMAWGNPWMYGSGINIGIYNFGGMGMGMGGGFGRWNPMWGYTNPVIVGGGILPGRYTTNPNGYVYGARNTTGGVVSTQGRNASPRDMGGRLTNDPGSQISTPKVMSPRSAEGNRGGNRGDIQTRSTGNNTTGIRAGSINEGKATSIRNRSIVNTSPRNTSAIASRGNSPVLGGERQGSANRMGTIPNSSMRDRTATSNTNRIAPRNTRSNTDRFGTSSRTPAGRSGYSPATSSRPTMGTSRSNMGSSPRTSSGGSMRSSGTTPRSSGGSAPSRGGSRRGG